MPAVVTIGRPQARYSPFLTGERAMFDGAGSTKESATSAAESSEGISSRVADRTTHGMPRRAAAAEKATGGSFDSTNSITSGFSLRAEATKSSIASVQY